MGWKTIAEGDYNTFKSSQPSVDDLPSGTQLRLDINTGSLPVAPIAGIIAIVAIVSYIIHEIRLTADVVGPVVSGLVVALLLIFGVLIFQSAKERRRSPP